MSGMYILIIVLAIHFDRAPAALSVEFNSFEACNRARESVVKLHNAASVSILSHGCYKK